jgi:hypothetical protein
MTKTQIYNREIELGIREVKIKQTKEHIQTRIKNLFGKSRSEETRKRISKTIQEEGYLIPDEIFEMKKIKKECQICKDDKKLQIHHINGDTKNNNHRNLGVVCSYCHFAIHDNGKNTRYRIGHIRPLEQCKRHSDFMKEAWKQNPNLYNRWIK